MSTLFATQHRCCPTLPHCGWPIRACSVLQITKLLIVPCVCLLETLLQQKTFTMAETLSIATVVMGVGIV
jgi:hypothetical protein